MNHFTAGQNIIWNYTGYTRKGEAEQRSEKGVILAVTFNTEKMEVSGYKVKLESGSIERFADRVKFPASMGMPVSELTPTN